MVYCSPVVLAVLLVMKLIKYETANSFSCVLRTYEISYSIMLRFCVLVVD